MSQPFWQTTYFAITLPQQSTHLLSRGVGGRMIPPLCRWAAERCGSHSTAFCCPHPSECSPASGSGAAEEKNIRKCLNFQDFSTPEDRLVYLVLGKSDGGVKHRPDDALKAGGRGERPLVSEEVVEVLGKHGAHVDARDVHGLTCQGGGHSSLSKWPQVSWRKQWVHVKLTCILDFLQVCNEIAVVSVLKVTILETKKRGIKQGSENFQLKTTRKVEVESKLLQKIILIMWKMFFFYSNAFL